MNAHRTSNVGKSRHKNNLRQAFLTSKSKKSNLSVPELNKNWLVVRIDDFFSAQVATRGDEKSFFKHQVRIPVKTTHQARMSLKSCLTRCKLLGLSRFWEQIDKLKQALAKMDANLILFLIPFKIVYAIQKLKKTINNHFWGFYGTNTYNFTRQ